jgi:hypothetical protein
MSQEYPQQEKLYIGATIEEVTVEMPPPLQIKRKDITPCLVGKTTTIEEELIEEKARDITKSLKENFNSTNVLGGDKRRL